MTTTFLIIGLLIATTGLLINVVDAFRVDTRWGRIVMFIPFASFVFAARHWDEAKRGCLLSLIGILVVVGIMWSEALRISLTPSQTDLEKNRRPPSLVDIVSLNAPPNAKAPFVPKSPAVTNTSNISKASLPDLPGTAAINDSLVAPTNNRPIIKELSLTELTSYTQRNVEVITKDGRKHYGELAQISDEALGIEKTFEGGMVTFNIPVENVKQIKILP